MTLTGITILPLQDSLSKYHDSLLEEVKHIDKETLAKHFDKDIQNN